MKLSELYANTGVEEHGNIVVAGGRVYALTNQGIEEHILQPDGELLLVRRDMAVEIATIRQDLTEIKAKLGI